MSGFLNSDRFEEWLMRPGLEETRHSDDCSQMCDVVLPDKREGQDFHGSGAPGTPQLIV